MGSKSRQSLHRREQDALRAVVKAIREASGQSQRELSANLRMPHTHLARVESGQRTLDVVEFLDIAQALDRDPAEVFAMFLKEARLG